MSTSTSYDALTAVLRGADAADWLGELQAEYELVAAANRDSMGAEGGAANHAALKVGFAAVLHLARQLSDVELGAEEREECVDAGVDVLRAVPSLHEELVQFKPATWTEVEQWNEVALGVQVLLDAAEERRRAQFVQALLQSPYFQQRFSRYTGGT